MMKLHRMVALAGLAAGLTLGSNQVGAQGTTPAAPPAPGQGPGPGGRQGRGNFDPAQMQQRMMERWKEQLEVTDEAEWKVIEGRIQKVNESRRSIGMGGGMGMFGRGGRPPGGDPAAAAGADQPQRRRFGPEPSPEAETLQKAIDGKASNAELKAAVEKFQASRKVKQADLEKAQAELRKLLSPRQEAIATLNGLL